MIKLLCDYRLTKKGSVVSWGKGLESIAVNLKYAEYVESAPVLKTCDIPGPKDRRRK